MTGLQRRAMHQVAPPEEAASIYRMPRQQRYDVIIIGGGSAGLPAADFASSLGAHVALLDREKLGGECLYTGCVPSKALLHVARIAAQVRNAGTLGLSAQLAPVDLSAVRAYVQRTISEIYVESDAPENYLPRGIDVIFGEVHFTGPDSLTINGQTISAKHFLICTGSHPAIPAVPGLDVAGYVTNENVFEMSQLPADLVVIGGGPIGCELGQAFARLGSHVTILQRNARILPKDEPEAAEVLYARLEREGVAIMTHADIHSVSVSEGHKVIEVQTPKDTFHVLADEILVATGRAPNVAGLGLEAAHVTYHAQKGITVDGDLRTSNPHIYAAGDVTGGYLFTHAAALQAHAAMRNMLFPGHSAVDERVMPWATFTEPEVAHVGLTEVQARKQHGDDARVYTQALSGVDRAVTEDETAGFIKLICLPDGKMLGAEIVGPSAGDIINELALAMQQGITLGQIADTTHVYPTVALGVQQAAGKFSLEKAAGSPFVKLLRTIAK